jgi:hypothetical protein
MLTILNSSHIPTNRCVSGHRACRTNTGFSLSTGESRRVQHENIALINRRFRFAWQIGQWVRHEGVIKNRRVALHK